jgi:glucosylglycerate phosphorylase
METPKPISKSKFSKIHERLCLLYGSEKANQIEKSIEKLLAYYSDRITPKSSHWSQQSVLLITYADTLLGDDRPLQVLRDFIKKWLSNNITTIHLLPFYPYTSDDGFSVTDYRQVRPDLGSWEDVNNLSNDYSLVFDGVINHVSASSQYVKGFLSGDPQFRDFCIALPPDTDTSAVLRTRNLPLLHRYEGHDGPHWLWTTFSQDQIDLNFSNPNVLLEIIDVLLFYVEQRAALIRLDAIPYLWKKLGTSCAHLRETHEIIKLFRDVLDIEAPHVALLTETNVPYQENITYFGDNGDEAQIIYNFTLAPLIVWSFLKGNTTALTQWAKQIRWISPRATYLNITATHDGIGMRPTEGILTEVERQELVQMACNRGGSVTGKKNSDGSLSPYELNISYFDAINDPKHPEPIEIETAKFIASQAIPMVLIGIPGIYIHSLLGSRNDTEGVNKTGRSRSINRKQLNIDQLEQDLEQPENLRSRVLKAFLKLLKIRALESAFYPDSVQEILSLAPEIFAVKRSNPTSQNIILALFNVTSIPVRISLPEGIQDHKWIDLCDDQKSLINSKLELKPYQFVWLKRV